MSMQTTPNRPSQGDGNTPARGKGNDDRQHYTPYLLLRAEAGDSGARPLPASEVFWESPDVWTVGSHGVNQPVAGEPTQVFARISNLGLQDATGVTVKFWWANPSIAITELNAHLIGIGYTSVLANSAKVLQCPVDWVPTDENGGHECLVVEAYIPVYDPMTQPMLPQDDRHVGQKNESVLLLQPGQPFHFPLEAFNFTIERQHLAIEARRTVVPRDFTQRFRGRAEWTAPVVDAARTPPLALRVHADCHCVKTGSRHGRAQVFAAAAGRLPGHDPCLPPPIAGVTQAFEPGEVRRVAVEGAMPATAQPGEVHALRIAQRIGDVVTGGYTLYLACAAPPKR